CLSSSIALAMGSVWGTGIEFGTVSAEKDGQQIEITTFRSDVYDGQRGTLRCSSATHWRTSSK
ncbi:hypothetical protein, partial [Klebsiella aerogenes]|uniref:hypothetical protein n=1 Tax=Klebsiella aerogenes TaxID=548 RepID=UPI00195456AF